MTRIKKLLWKIFRHFSGKKRIVLFIIAAVFWAAVCTGLVLLRLSWLAIALSALLIAAIAVILLARRAYDKWLLEEKPTSYFRNMDAIAVGSTKAWKYLRSKGLEDRLYLCTTYRRSLTMDYATLKTFYSHVHPGGKAFLFIDWKEINEIGEKIFVRDWKYVHSLTFLAMGKKNNNVTKLNPLTHDTRFLFSYFFLSVLKRLGFFKVFSWRKTNKKNLDIDTAQVKKLVDRLSEIVQFCYNRDIEPVLLLLSGDADTNCANEIIHAYLAPRDYDLTVKIVPNEKEMNRLVRSLI